MKSTSGTGQSPNRRPARTILCDGSLPGKRETAPQITHRPRPFVAHPQIHPLYVVHSSSFPAGHAATAFAGATLLTYVAPRLWPLFVGLATAVSFSRVYVGVHYPTDVLAGAAIGVGIGALGIAALMLLERWNPHSSVTPRRAAPARRGPAASANVAIDEKNWPPAVVVLTRNSPPCLLTASADPFNVGVTDSVGASATGATSRSTRAWP